MVLPAAVRGCSASECVCRCCRRTRDNSAQRMHSTEGALAGEQRVRLSWWSEHVEAWGEAAGAAAVLDAHQRGVPALRDQRSPPREAAPSS
eukprot:2968711-Rhodomonas_salina.3